MELSKIMEHTIAKISEEVHDLKNKINKLYAALLGSELAQDGGLVARIQNLEKVAETIDKKVERVELGNAKTAIYVKIIWLMSGFVLASIMTIILQNTLKK
jgi:proline dehydrogenase